MPKVGSNFRGVVGGVLGSGGWGGYSKGETNDENIHPGLDQPVAKVAPPLSATEQMLASTTPGQRGHEAQLHSGLSDVQLAANMHNDELKHSNDVWVNSQQAYDAGKISGDNINAASAVIGHAVRNGSDYADGQFNYTASAGHPRAPFQAGDVYNLQLPGGIDTDGSA